MYSAVPQIDFSQLNSAIMATVSGLIGGALIKLATKLSNRRKEYLEEHIILRKELREELDVTKEEAQNLETELDLWKGKYYRQVQLTNELQMNIVNLTDELNECKQLTMINSKLDEFTE